MFGIKQEQSVTGRRLVLGLTFVCLALITASQVAYAFDPTLPPPLVSQIVDVNGINLTTKQNQLFIAAVSIGQPGRGGLRFAIGGASSDSSWGGSVILQPSLFYDPVTGWWIDRYTVTINGHPTPFDKSHAPASAFSVADGSGSTLSFDGAVYHFTAHDGSTALFSSFSTTCFDPSCTVAIISTLAKPSGEIFRYTFAWGPSLRPYVLTSVTNNLGYQLKFNYACQDYTLPCFAEITQVIAINNAVDYCDPNANSCDSLSQAWPTLTQHFNSSSEVDSVTDPEGNLTTYSHMHESGDAYWYDVVTFPSDRTLTTTHCECFPSFTDYFTVSDGVGTWTYYFHPDTPATGRVTADVTDPNGNVREVVSDATTGQIISDTIDPGSGHLNLVTAYGYNSQTQLTSVTYPEGNSVNYTYDARGNVTQTQWIAKPGSGTANITTTASFASACDPGQEKVCNQPVSATNANGQTTDYTYDVASGNVLTVTAPLVSGGRPQARFSYSALYAWYKNSSGVIVAASSPVYEPTQVSQCMMFPSGSFWGSATWGNFTWTSASCAGTAREQLITTAYAGGSSSVATNLQPASVTTAAGDASVSSTTSWTYDSYGNTASITGPISGSTSLAFYDLNQRPVGSVGPDPDGGGPLLNPATKIVYAPDGQVASSSQGTSNGASYSAWASSFTGLAQVSHQFDSHTGLVTNDESLAGGTAVGMTWYSYDAGRRLVCAAIRNNPSYWSTSAACTPTTPGSNGPDQITQINYDAANRVTSVVKGYGSGSPVTDRTIAYGSGTNLVSGVIDGNGNTTGYAYDGQGRMVQANFANSSYEQYGYDANGNVTSHRLRSGDTLSNNYDALNRLTSIDMPGGTASDTYFGYDLLGDRLYARYGSAGGTGVDFTYDALQRKTSETANGHTVGSQYDAAGNRTRLTYPDSNYIQYSYDILNRMQTVQENGGTTLAAYSYDDLGRETGLIRGNGVNSTASYSGTSLSWTLGVSGASQNVSFGLVYSPAGQVSQRTISNGVYAYSAPASSVGYSANVMNQYAGVGGTTYSYDGNGNLTGDGSRALSYDLYNRLTTVTGPSTFSTDLAYDPLGRLQQMVFSTGPAGTHTNWGAANWGAFEWSGRTFDTRYLYDSDALIVEYDASGNILRRYVPGAGVDETLVWYEGSGLATPNWLVTDQQGSVVATTDASGTAGTTAYDPYGVPSAWSPLPRFGYTGQVALNPLQLYDYKARMYDPRLGRFLQADPAGYYAGLNLYAYTGNDPVNATDPSGLDDIETVQVNATYNPCQSLIVCFGVDITRGWGIVANLFVSPAEAATPASTPQSQPPTINGTNQNDWRNQVCRIVLPYAQTAIRVGTSFQDVGITGKITGGALAAAGAPIAGVGAAPGLALAELGELSDQAGTFVRGLGAGAIWAVTGDLRPGLEAALGYSTGRFAPLVAQPFVDAAVGYGLGKSFGSDNPQCGGRRDDERK